MAAIYLRTAANCRPSACGCRRCPDGLKKLLGAVSADITVELDGAQLFYPEYSEFLDENTPAHIFNHSIEGEGYRMRQCFTPGGAVDYAAFECVVCAGLRRRERGQALPVSTRAACAAVWTG